MPDAATTDDVTAAWKSLPRDKRATLASDAARGLKGRDRKDAAFMLWWATRELDRGPRPGLAVAGVIAVAVIVVQLAQGVGIAEIMSGLGSSAIPIILLIPLATWFFRRPKLQRSVQRNAGLLSGKTFDAPPDAQDTERILARAKRDGLLT